MAFKIGFRKLKLMDGKIKSKLGMGNLSPIPPPKLPEPPPFPLRLPPGPEVPGPELELPVAL